MLHHDNLYFSRLTQLVDDMNAMRDSLQAQIDNQKEIDDDAEAKRFDIHLNTDVSTNPKYSYK